ncbi:hypothetical protein [Chitinophaga rhizosphaerae]|uniref:hypothetical protein n=1 Tax=Chitinophaga rhizosphaerae TaxID=1864947 RepID=UPI0013E00C53|nr:hypothetical protein [Chitinophaga rhizosphaerae]
MKNIFAFLMLMLLSSGGFSIVRTIDADTSILTSDGVRLYMKSGGTEIPSIFIHGGPGAWSKSYEVRGGNSLEGTL